MTTAPLPLDCLPSQFQWANFVRYNRRKAFEARRDGTAALLSVYEDRLSYSREHLETLVESTGHNHLWSVEGVARALQQYTDVLLLINRSHTVLDNAGEEVFHYRSPLDTHHLSHGVVTITPEAL